MHDFIWFEVTTAEPAIYSVRDFALYHLAVRIGGNVGIPVKHVGTLLTLPQEFIGRLIGVLGSCAVVKKIGNVRDDSGILEKMDGPNIGYSMSRERAKRWRIHGTFKDEAQRVVEWKLEENNSTGDGVPPSCLFALVVRWDGDGEEGVEGFMSRCPSRR